MSGGYGAEEKVAMARGVEDAYAYVDEIVRVSSRLALSGQRVCVI
jgi:hypothetical protein